MTARYSTLGDIVRIAAQPKLMTDDRFAWQDEALCREVDAGDLWFPEPGGNANAGKRICADCPVQKDCLQYSIDENIKFGIWGGLSEAERRGLTSADGQSARPVVLACKRCGTTFHAHSKIAKWCGKACERAAQRDRAKAAKEQAA